MLKFRIRLEALKAIILGMCLWSNFMCLAQDQGYLVELSGSKHYDSSTITDVIFRTYLQQKDLQSLKPDTVRFDLDFSLHGLAPFLNQRFGKKLLKIDEGASARDIIEFRCSGVIPVHLSDSLPGLKYIFQTGDGYDLTVKFTKVLLSYCFVSPYSYFDKPWDGVIGLKAQPVVLDCWNAEEVDKFYSLMEQIADLKGYRH